MPTVSKDKAALLLEGVYTLSDDEINVLASLPEDSPVSAVVIASDLHILPRSLSAIIDKLQGLDYVVPAETSTDEQGHSGLRAGVYEVKLSDVGKRAQVLTKLVKSKGGTVLLSPNSQKLAKKLNLA